MLQERDFTLFADLYRYRVLNQPQIQRLHFPSNDRAQQRLRQLYDAGYIYRLRRNEWVQGGGRKPTLYVLDKKGADALRQRQETVIWHYSYKTPSSQYLRHAIPLNEVAVVVRLACRNLEYEIRHWETEAELKVRPERVYVRVNGKRENVAVIPDSFFVFQTSRGAFPFMVEWDGTTQRKLVIQKKVRAYKAFYESGKYSKRYNLKRFRVVFATKTQARLKTLKTWTEELKFKPSIQRAFLFAKLPDLTPETIFTKPVWHYAGVNKPQPFFSKQQ